MNLLPVDQAMWDARQRHQAGRLAEAETLYREVLAQDPNHLEALHLLGILAGQAGRPEQALQLIGRAVEIDPGNAEAQGNLGATLRTLGRVEEAIAAFREVVRLQPGSAEARGRLGEVCLGAKRFEEAIEAFGEAIRLDPERARDHGNLGMALRTVGRLDEAIAEHREAIRLGENSDGVQHYNLGYALQWAGKIPEAIESYRQALRLCPTLAEAYNNLGNCFQAEGESDAAVDAYQAALEFRPGSIEFRNNLSGALLSRGEIDAAAAILREALELQPEDAGLRSSLISTLLFHPESDSASLCEECRIWHRLHELPLLPFLRPPGNDASPGRRLRIGYVSPDFRRHVIGQNFLPLLREHDRQFFMVFCYSNVMRPDAVTEEIRFLADGWRDILGISDEAAAELIRADEIDILVDLTLHLAGNRLPVFARKPAPVQASYLAYCGSTGLEAIDYRLSDPYLDPAGVEMAYYSEETIPLRRSYWCYQPLEACPEASPSPLPALSAGHVTFGCLNNFAKVSPAALDLWLEILEAVAQARLLLAAPPGSCREKIRQRFAEQGISCERIEFVGKQPWEGYIRTLQRIDVALDPFPYGGGITTCDALWMGVPVVSGLGSMGVGRGGRSILANIGLPELIAETPRQYLEIAASLAADWPRLSGLRSSLRERMEASPLRDAKGFARDVESAYRLMWSNWADCQRKRKSPDSEISIPKS
jgi:protein O-GlcNAc transferase